MLGAMGAANTRTETTEMREACTRHGGIQNCVGINFIIIRRERRLCACCIVQSQRMRVTLP